MTKLKCTNCETYKANVQIRECGDKLCEECFEDGQEKKTDEEQTEAVSDDTGIHQPTPGPRTKVVNEDMNFTVLFNKITELCQKVGQILSIKDRIEDPTKSVTFMNNMYEEQKKNTDLLVTENKAMREELAVVMNSVCDLQKNNNELKCRLDEIEQYSRCNNLEILGVPQTHAEDVDEIVMKVAEKLGDCVEKKDIEAAHRVPTTSQNHPRPIVVRFCSRRTKERMFAKSKKTRLTAKDLHASFPSSLCT